MNPKISAGIISGLLLSAAGCASLDSGMISEVESVVIYSSAQKPGHTAWPKPFLDAAGNVCVIFQQITGDITRPASYDFRREPEKYQIKLICMRALKGTSEFEIIWEKECINASSFFIPALTPTPDGRMVAVCRPDIQEENSDLPEGSFVIMESADCGRTMTRRSSYHVPGYHFYPNDIKYIGSRLYMASYDGRGAAHLLYSDDDGVTWSEPLEIVRAHDNMSFHEPTFCELSNGDLMVFLRTHRMDIPKHNGINYHKVIIHKDAAGNLSVAADETSQTLNYTFDENGKLLVSPVSDSGFGFRGRPHLQRMSNGTIVLVAPGSFMALSNDEGVTWHSGLWDFNIQKVQITDRFGTKPYNWNAETMVLELPDGRVFYSYFVGSDFPFPAPCDMYIGGTFFRLNSGK